MSVFALYRQWRRQLLQRREQVAAQKEKDIQDMITEFPELGEYVARCYYSDYTPTALWASKKVSEAIELRAQEKRIRKIVREEVQTITKPVEEL